MKRPQFIPKSMDFIKRLLSTLSVVLLPLLLQIISQSSAEQLGVCQTLNRNPYTNYVNPCGTTVDYAFFIPNGLLQYSTVLGITAQEYLQQQAQKQLNNAKLKQVSTTCQQTIISLVCANIYIKCFGYGSSPQLLNYEPYGVDSNYSFGLQLYRPCASLCTNMPTQCTGLYSAFNTYPNCTQRFDYSYGVVSATKAPLQYDHSNNQSFCFVPKSVPVAENAEPYLGQFNGGVCAGLFTTVFTPAGSVFNTTFAVMQGPHVIQKFVEMAARAKWNSLPTWLSPDCLEAARRDICSRLFPVAQVKPIYTVLVENHVPPQVIAGLAAQNPALASTVLTIPSFYNYSICKNFEETCSGFLDLAVQQGKPPLNCSETTLQNGLLLHYFSYKRQVVTALPFNPLPLLVYSDVAQYSAKTNESAIVASCPATFVVPDDPNNPHTVYTPTGANSTCAIPCRSPGVDDDNWSTLVLAAFIVPLVAVILSGLMIISLIFKTVLYWQEKARQSVSSLTSFDVQATLLYLYALLSLVISAYSLALNVRQRDDRFCYNNSVPLSLTIGQSMCTTQAGIIVYATIAISLTFLMMFVHRLLHSWFYSRLPGRQENSTTSSVGFIILSFIVILLMPIKPLVYSYENKLLGFIRSNAYCGLLQKPAFSDSLAIQGFDIPILVSGALCLLGCFLDLITSLFRWLCCRRADKRRIYVAANTGAPLQPHIDALSNYNRQEEAPGVEMQTVAQVNNTSTTISNQPALEEKDIISYPSGSTVAYFGYDARLYILPIVVIYILILVVRLSYYIGYNAASSSLQDWATCVFKNTSKWAATCGDQPGTAPSMPLLICAIIVFTGNSIIFVPVYFFNSYLLPLCFSLPPDADIKPGTKPIAVINDNYNSDDKKNITSDKYTVSSNNSNNNNSTGNNPNREEEAPLRRGSGATNTRQAFLNAEPSQSMEAVNMVENIQDVENNIRD